MTTPTFKSAAETNNFDGFEELWDKSTTEQSDLEALRWACIYNREDMVECVLYTPDALKNTDITVALKDAVAHKSLNAIGRVLRWSEQNNSFARAWMGQVPYKYMLEVGRAALQSDWSAIFTAQQVRFKNIPYLELKELHLDAIRTGAVECLSVFDLGLSFTNWDEAIKEAASHHQSRSVRYLGHNIKGFATHNSKDTMLQLLHKFVSDPSLFRFPQAAECAAALMEFATVDELRCKYPRTREARFDSVFEKLTSLHENTILTETVNTVSTANDTPKRKM